MKKLVANRLKTAREDAGLTQAELADMLGFARSSYTQVETARNWLSVGHLIQLSEILHKPVEYLLGIPALGSLNQEEKEVLDLFRSFPDNFVRQAVLHFLRALFQGIEEFEQASPLAIQEIRAMHHDPGTPGLDKITDLIQKLDSNALRQVYDFAAWQIAEQGQQPAEPEMGDKDREWLEFLETLTPEKRTQVMKNLYRLYGPGGSRSRRSPGNRESGPDQEHRLANQGTLF